MITNESNPLDFKPKSTLKIGDLSLWGAAKSSPIPKMLMFETGKGVWKLLGQWRKFTTAVMAYSQNVIFRRCFGKTQSGIIATICGLSIILATNSTHVLPGLSVFGIFFVPIVTFFSDKDAIYTYIFEETHSSGLTAYAILYTICSLYNTVLTFIGRSHKDISKRGESWIFSALSWAFNRKKGPRINQFKVNELFCTLFLETAIMTSIGFSAWFIFADYYLAIFCWTATTCEAAQLLDDTAYQIRQEPVLRA